MNRARGGLRGTSNSRQHPARGGGDAPTSGLDEPVAVEASNAPDGTETPPVIDASETPAARLGGSVGPPPAAATPVPVPTPVTPSGPSLPVVPAPEPLASHAATLPMATPATAAIGVLSEVAVGPPPVPLRDDLMPSRATLSRRARRRAQQRNRMLLGGAAAMAAIVGLAVVAFTARGGDDHSPARTDARSRTATGRTHTSTTTESVDNGTSTTTTTVTTALPAPASSSAAASGTVPSLAAPGEVTALIEQSSGACRYDADAGELMDAGTVHNPGTAEAVVEIDVTFVDATGELDSASDLESVGPDQTIGWEASTPAFDPPQGALTCQVTQG